MNLILRGKVNKTFKVVFILFLVISLLCCVGCDSPAPNKSSIKLDPDRLVCNIPFSPWQKLLIAVREKDDDKLQTIVKVIP